MLTNFDRNWCVVPWTNWQHSMIKFTHLIKTVAKRYDLQQLISVWAEFNQSIIDKAIDKWQPRL